MNKKKILYWQVGAIIFTWIIGTLLHFTYEWSGENVAIGIFSAVNESTWEHLKLTFFPMLLFSVIEGVFLYKYSNNYIEAKTIGIFLSIVMIITIFYTYTGILGTNFAFIDILTFLVSVLVSEYVSYKILLMKEQSNIITKTLSAVIIIFLLICFIKFTFTPPKVQLFEDPINGTYGILKD